MKSEFTSKFTSKIFIHASIRVFLSSVVICVFVLGMNLFIADFALVILISIPAVAVMCLFTAMIIARYAKALADNQFDMLNKSVETLKEASQYLADVAKSVYCNAYMMKGAASKFFGNSEAHSEASIDEK